MAHALRIDDAGRARSRTFYGALDRLLERYGDRRARARERRSALLMSEEANTLVQLRDRQMRYRRREIDRPSP